MSRSGYSDYDCDNGQLWRGAVERAIKGYRGQAFLKALLAALDAMPEKRLIPYELEENGEVCSIGALGRARGLDMPKHIEDMDDNGNFAANWISNHFNIAEALAREVMYNNDEAYNWCSYEETPEKRWTRMRNWVAGLICG
jgi:hypothetical protein